MGQLLKLLLLTCLVAIVVGCGGGSTDTSSAANVPIYVTDGSGTYSHAWVTVKQIDIVGKSGAVTAYQDAAGQTLDLAALSSSTKQQFALVAIGKAPSATTVTLRITVDQNVNLVPAGTSAASTYPLAGSVGGVKVFTITVAGNDPRGIVADFDLGKWKVDGGSVTATPKNGSTSGLGGDTHPHQYFKGTVANLAGTSPNFTFDLIHGEHKLAVTTSVDTIIANADGTSSPILANGVVVHVGGTFDHTTSSIAAAEILISNGSISHPPAFVAGTVQSIGVHTFTVTPRDVIDMRPVASLVVINTTADTLFFKDAVSISSAEFDAAIAVGSLVMVHGTVDDASGVMTAAHVNLVGPKDGDHHGAVGVAGAIDSLDAKAGTFNITVKHWEGRELHAGDVLHVVTNDKTVFVGTSLMHMANGDVLKVAGALEGSTLTALVVGKGDGHGDGPDGGPDGGPDDGHGGGHSDGHP